ncbi:MAG: hypothetical protein Q9193_005773 [Seirophora villosa]
MSADESPYSNYVVYGPDANCTLALCPPELSVYQYQPTLPGNICFLIFFAIAMIIHLIIGLKWRTWFFVICMFWGCVSEIIGYGGRIMLHYNPFSFTGFLIQITYYWIFIPCDILSLLLQSVGGALSSTSEGGSNAAVNVSIAGLSFQVFTLLVFISLCLEYAWRWQRARKASGVKEPLSRPFKIFVTFLSAGTLLIFIRCIYRIDEMVLVAVYCLILAHPGPVFQGFDDEKAIREGSAGAHLERKNNETA